MARPLSPIHAPIDVLDSANPTANPPAVLQPHARIARLAELDSRVLAGRQHKIGPGGASTVFARAVDKALTEELAAQLRGKEPGASEIGAWAVDIIDAFSEE